MTNMREPDLDATYDSAALWFERAGRYLRLALDAKDMADAYAARSQNLVHNDPRLREHYAAQDYRMMEREYFKMAKRLADEGRRAEKLGRI